MEPNPSARSSSEPLTDEEIARRVLAGERSLFELLMRRNNQRVYRAVRSLLRDEAEVEDVMQQAYLLAYSHLADFRGGARFSTWLVRIAVNEALGRLRRARGLVVVSDEPLDLERGMRPSAASTPEELAASRELIGLVQRSVDALPDIYRIVVMLREVEGMSTRETAEALSLSEEVVKTRLHRARVMLQEGLADAVETHFAEAYPFHAPRCDRVVEAVLAELARR